MPIRIDKVSNLEWIMAIFLAGSFALLSFYQLVYYQRWFIIFTVVLSFLLSLYFVLKTYKENGEYIKSHSAISFVMILLAVLLVRAMYQAKGVPNLEVRFELLPFSFFCFQWWLWAIPALFYLLIWIWRKASRFFVDFWDGLDGENKRLYIVLTIVFSSIIPILYLVEPQWYLQYDQVYSIDSGYCYQRLFPQMTYYDIRHPALSVIAFPIWSIVECILRLFVPRQFLSILCVACVQLVNIQFLLIIGLMIGKLSKSKWIPLLYMASSPVLLFVMFFEKYQLCIFLLVIYVYQLCQRAKNTEVSLILATGAMATSIFIVLSEWFIREPIQAKSNKMNNIAKNKQKIENNEWHVKGKQFCRMIIFGIAFLISTGRIHLLNPMILLAEVQHTAQRFGLKSLSVTECLNSLTKMVHGSFLSLSSVSEAKYIWSDIMGSVSLIGVFILVISIMGIIVNRRENFVKVCTVWLSFAFLLFTVFQWSVHESPLFSIYFSWAIIPLFQKGLQYMIDKFHWQERLVYVPLLLVMLVVNVLDIVNIGMFLKRVV